MKLRNAIGPLAVVSTLAACTEPTPRNLTCSEIRSEIAQLTELNKGGIGSEGAAVKKVTRDGRIQALKAAAWDKDCKK